MKIIVLLKEVPESNRVEIEKRSGKPRLLTGERVLNHDDGNNLETALNIKDRYPETRISLLSMGGDGARKVLREGLSVGADEAYLIRTDCFKEEDSLFNSCCLAQAIKRMGGGDLILTGYQSQDGRKGTIGPMVAALLDIPQVTHSEESIEIDGDSIRVTKNLMTVKEEISVSTPCLISNLPGPYRLRGADYLGIVAALEKGITIWEEETLWQEASAAETESPSAEEAIVEESAEPGSIASGYRVERPVRSDLTVLYAEPAFKGRKRLIAKLDDEREAGEAIKGIIDNLVLYHHSRR